MSILSGPMELVVSAYGGLRLEGIVGTGDPLAELVVPPGEGKRGVTSGASSVYGES